MTDTELAAAGYEVAWNGTFDRAEVEAVGHVVSTPLVRSVAPLSTGPTRLDRLRVWLAQRPPDAGAFTTADVAPALRVTRQEAAEILCRARYRALVVLVGRELGRRGGPRKMWLSAT